MTHEPECAAYWPDGDGFDVCICERVRAAYQRGKDAGYNWGYVDGSKDAREAGFREGYNAHAESRAHAEQMYGPYRVTPGFLQASEGWNQHGQGENP